MREIKKVLSTVNFSEEDLNTLRSFFPDSRFVHVANSDTERIVTELKDTDVAILDADLDERFLGESQLKWIHCSHAGLAKSARPEVFQKNIILTGSAGRSAPVLAEHAIYFMLNACYHTHEMLSAQYAHQWGIPGMHLWRGLFGRTAGIVGLGNTGKCLAERLHAMGMELYGYDRYEPEGYDYMHKLISSRGDTMDEMLEKCDFIILCIALTDDTYHMIDENAFRKMKKGMVFVNMARGALVDTQALIRALDEGIVQCAGLDVFEEEPLPPDHPLWSRKDVYITPHATPAVPHRDGRSLEIIKENVRRYLQEEEMLNRVYPMDQYTH